MLPTCASCGRLGAQHLAAARAPWHDVNGLQASSDLLEHIAAINFLRREAGLRCSAHQPTSWYSPPPPSKRCLLLQPELGTCNPLSGHHGRRAEALLTFRTSAPAARDAEQQ